MNRTIVLASHMPWCFGQNYDQADVLRRPTLQRRPQYFGGNYVQEIIDKAPQVLSNDYDLLNPPAEIEKRKHKLKRLVQSPNSFFMDVKCQGCFNIVRALCGLNSKRNCVHGSDSPQSVARERSFFFKNSSSVEIVMQNVNLDTRESCRGSK